MLDNSIDKFVSLLPTNDGELGLWFAYIFTGYLIISIIFRFLRQAEGHPDIAFFVGASFGGLIMAVGLLCIGLAISPNTVAPVLTSPYARLVSYAVGIVATIVTLIGMIGGYSTIFGRKPERIEIKKDSSFISKVSVWTRFLIQIMFVIAAFVTVWQFINGEIFVDEETRLFLRLPLY